MAASQLLVLAMTDIPAQKHTGTSGAFLPHDFEGKRDHGSVFHCHFVTPILQQILGGETRVITLANIVAPTIHVII